MMMPLTPNSHSLSHPEPDSKFQFLFTFPPFSNRSIHSLLSSAAAAGGGHGASAAAAAVDGVTTAHVRYDLMEAFEEVSGQLRPHAMARGGLAARIGLGRGKHGERGQ